MIAIIDDTYKNRPVRIYTEYAPTLRAERDGLKVVFMNNVDSKNDNYTINKSDIKECNDERTELM